MFGSFLNTYVVQDPITDLREKKFYGIWKGARQNTYTPNISTSFSNSQINFSVPPPSPKTIIDRVVYLAVPIQVTITGNTGDPAKPIMNYGLTDAFRAFPLAQVIQTLAVTFNNNSISINMNDVFPTLLRFYGCQHDDFINYSNQPSFQDQSQEYWDLVGTIRNPLAGYTDGVPYQTKRGEFPVSVLQNTSTQAVVQAFIITPLFMSPLLFKGHEPGFVGLQNFNFIFTLGDLSRVWSRAIDPTNPNIVTSITATIQGVNVGPNQNAPQLLFRYLTPHENDIIPMESIYSLFDLQRYPTDIGTVNGDTQVTVSSNNIQLNTIPRRAYFFVRRRNQDLTAFTTDTFATIEKIVINYDNQAGLLSSATKENLYQMSVKNGCTMSWPQWNGYAGNSYGNNIPDVNMVRTVGSILCVEFGSDIGLPLTDAPGKLGTYQLQVQLTFRNCNINPVNFTFYIVIVSEGIFTITQNTARSEIGVVTEAEILNSAQWPKADLKSMQTIYGGDFTGNFKNFVNKISDVYQKVSPYLQTGMRIARNVAPMVAPLLGLGRAPQTKYTPMKRSIPPYMDDPPEPPVSPTHSYQEDENEGMEGGELMSLSELRRRAMQK